MKLRRSALQRERDLKWLRSMYSERESQQTINVYDAEQYGFATSEAVLRTKKDVKLFVAMVKRDPRWRAGHGRGPFKLKFLDNRKQCAWGGKYGVSLPDNPFGRSIHTILHEMSHAACYKRGHGPAFCRMLLYLMKKFEGTVFAERLHKRFYQTGALKHRRKR